MKNYVTMGPFGVAGFWNELFEQVGCLEHWVNGQEVTDEMAKMAAKVLVLACRGEKWSQYPLEENTMPDITKPTGIDA